MAGRRTIGLTGGIGSGKSTIAALLAERGATIVDADRIGHEVYRPGTPGFAAVVEAFGPDVVASDGTIDRRRLGAIVFADRDALARLNALVHPLIAAEIGRRVEAAHREPVATPIVVEAAILLEAGWEFFDEVWVVVVRPETAIARVTASRGLDRTEVERRMAAQLSNAERRARADRVFENDGTLAELRAQVATAWQALGCA